MDSEITKTSIDLLYKTTQEVGINAQMNLPEYCPEVSRILDCSVSLCTEAVTMTSDRISVSGKAKFSVIYLGENGKPAVFETVSKYTKNFGEGLFEATDHCRIEQKAGPLNYKATAPRRIDISLTVSVEAEVYRLTPYSCTSAEEDGPVQMHLFHTPVFDVASLATVKLELADKLPLPVEKDRINGILRIDADPRLTEISAIKNKMLLKGTVEITYSCVDVDGRIYGNLRCSVPFSEVKDVYGVDENAALRICVKSAEADADYRSASFSEREAPLEMHLEIAVLTGNENELVFPDDAYLPGGKMELEMKDVVVSTEAKEIRLSTPYSYSADGIEKDISSVCDCFVGELQYRVAKQNETAQLIASFRVHALLELADGTTYCVSRKVSLTTDLPSMTSEASILVLRPYLSELSSQTASDRSLSFSGTLNVEGFVVSQVPKKVISRIKTKSFPEIANEKIVVYYASEGESLWDIAKTADVSYAKAMAYNGITEDLMPEDRILLLS